MYREIELMTSSLKIDAKKSYFAGTHRSVNPKETFDRMWPWARRIGVTRVANVTGLDFVGIPVVMVVRPNAKSVAVSQGKGISLDAARASGLMESIELHCAENLDLPVSYNSYREMRRTKKVVDPDLLPKPASSRFHHDLPMLWVEGTDLATGESTWVPYELVTASSAYPLPPGSGSFRGTTNGLASGNNFAEAISHAICELIERDAVSLAEIKLEDKRLLDLSSVSEPDCLGVLERFSDADIHVTVHQAVSDTEIPVFTCTISDGVRVDAMGHGCHLDKNVALLRSLTEAAQTRLTLIAGSRDDLSWKMYQSASARIKPPNSDPPKSLVSFDAIPSKASVSLWEDVSSQLKALSSVGLLTAIAVDVTRTDLPCAVVRVIVPGLEGLRHDPNHPLGRRGQSALEIVANQ